MQPPRIPSKPLVETPFSYDVERRGDAAVVHLSGSCTMGESARLTETLVSLASEPVKLIVVDMACLDFIESTGLGGIIAGHLRCRRNQGEVRLAGPVPSICHLLELTRLNQLFRVTKTVEEALRAN